MASLTSVYSSFSAVYKDVVAGKFPNEPSLMQAFVEALKCELLRSPCNKYIVEHMIFPVLNEFLREGGKAPVFPDVLFSNVVIEVEPPGSNIDTGRAQLHSYMEALFRKIEGRAEVLGLVTNGAYAELWIYTRTGSAKVSDGDMPTVASQLLHVFCSSKIPVTTPGDLVRIFGV